MNKEEELYVALLIIELGGTFSNAYGLCRLLRRKFDIFICAEVIAGLIKNNFVTYVDEGGIKEFTINENGEQVLMQNRAHIIEVLKKHFSNELDLINQFNRL